MVDEIVDGVRPGASRARPRRHARRWRARRGAARQLPAAVRARPRSRRAGARARHGARLRRFGPRATTVHSRFDRLAEVIADAGIESLSGALFDLGVSSPQLDRARTRLQLPHTRGHSTCAWTARARPHRRRRRQRLRRGRPRQGHPRLRRRALRQPHRPGDRRRPADHDDDRARRDRDRGDPGGDTANRRPPGQAHLPGPAHRGQQRARPAPRALDQAIDATVPTGRVAVLTYHSGEDRLVKQRFAEAATRCLHCPPGLPCVCGAAPTVRRVRAPRTPSAEQAERNRRARSARLRVVEKLGG